MEYVKYYSSWFISVDYQGVALQNLVAKRSKTKNINPQDYADIKRIKTNLDDDLIDMAFDEGRANDRKKWINAANENEAVDTSSGKLSYAKFVTTELVHFSKYNLKRAVPNVMDGLKPSQRKVLFACFKRKLANDVKVAQLSGYISEKAAYHHGEVSLQGTIVKLAQTFVGSNNINLLVPSGQFGTRGIGGADHASARYIFTRLAKITRTIFPEEDDELLDYQEEDGMKIEPTQLY